MLLGIGGIYFYGMRPRSKDNLRKEYLLKEVTPLRQSQLISSINDIADRQACHARFKSACWQRLQPAFLSLANPVHKSL